MNYTIKAHQTQYSGVIFRSRLEARWACFFDLVNWEWKYEPIDLEGWVPDFMVKFPCCHSECGGSHELLVEVKPYFRIEEFDGHPCMKYPCGAYIGSNYEEGLRIPADASAAFGIDPSVTSWEMGHGSGGGIDKVEDWVDGDVNAIWKRAGNIVQWIPG